MNRSLLFSSERGFSLIEVLVTMIVVALGLLGFAALQAQSLKSNRTALQRSYATMLAYEIIDCMRANRNAAVGTVVANDGAYRIAFTDTAPNATSGTLAHSDMSAWRTSLATYLPSASARIHDAAQAASLKDPAVITVEVRWTENVNSNRTLTFSTQTNL
jgi:type IV pilus assembly protein PilV